MHASAMVRPDQFFSAIFRPIRRGPGRRPWPIVAARRGSPNAPRPRS